MKKLITDEERDRKDRVIHMNMSTTLHDSLRRLAKESNRTVAETIRGCILAGAKEYKRLLQEEPDNLKTIASKSRASDGPVIDAIEAAIRGE